MPDNGPPKNLLSLALKDDLFGIYIHWPFCASKCPYCDFNSHVRDTIDVDQWQKALLQDLAACHQDTSFKKVTSIFFGGGTPSTMPPQIVSALIQKIHDLWTVDVTIEITLEANPTSIEQSKFKDLSQAGINRVSLGIQSLDDQALKFLGRTHNAQEAFKAIEVAQNTFPKHNFDFIYTLPGQSLSSWKRQLKEAIQLGSSHLSLYQLTIEEGTPFYLRHAKGDFTMPTEDESASFFETTRTHMHESGFFAYEVSNFARSPETQCQHNLALIVGFAVFKHENKSLGSCAPTLTCSPNSTKATIVLYVDSEGLLRPSWQAKFVKTRTLCCWVFDLSLSTSTIG